MEEEEKHLYEHLEELRDRLIRILIAIGVISVITLTLTIKEFDLGFIIYLPYPELGNNIAMQVIKVLTDTLVPENVELIQTAPGQAFFAQLYVSLLLGVIVGMPIIVREIIAFFAPALYEHERKILKNITLPSIALFIVGAIFSYTLIIPFLLEFLYRYGEALGILTFLNITDFVTFILYFIIAFGISFQLPIIMYTVTKAEMVEPKFWRDNLRYAIIILVIFGAVITPDGSGVTMWFISLPMLALYVAGMLFIEVKMKKV
ncbi:MAG: twin-arginine translocase subunit TatC [Candidatus Nitrosocaldaceae archaeon]|nr:MAG: twin-arginine translocase subunit TatC [Candidatus Nitrosocaldaceae archaeon]